MCPLGEAVQHNTEFRRKKQPFQSIIRGENYLDAWAAAVRVHAKSSSDFAELKALPSLFLRLV